MSLITRQEKGSKLTVQEMDGNLEYLEQLAQQGGETFTDPREYTLDKTAITRYENGNFKLSPLDQGEIIFNNENLLFPENEIYVLSTVETYLKFAEAVSGEYDYNVESLIPNGYLNGRKINVVSNVNEYLKFLEATINQEIDYNYTNSTGFIDQYLELINDTTYFKEGELQRKGDFLDRLNVTGIVEMGQIGEGSKLVYSHILKNIILGIEQWLVLAESYGSDNDPILREIFLLILERGIVVRESKGNLIISSIETYLFFANAISTFEDYLEPEDGGGVPV
jgi:hypothetical protein